MTQAPPATGAAETPPPSHANPTTAKDWPWSRRKPKLDVDFKELPVKGWQATLNPWKLNGRTLEYQALKYPPAESDLKEFEGEKWRPRQLILARLRMLGSQVNLKTLPVVTALVAVAAAVIGLSLSSSKSDQTGFYDLYLTGIIYFLAIAAVIVLLAIRNHTSKEACLTAWTEAFEDSHSLQTKKEEEKRKADADETAPPAAPSVDRHAWVVKIFG